LEGKSIVARESGLYKDLTRGQIIMISLGGAIGTSLFLSIGMAVGYAGLRFWSAMPLPPFSLARAEAIHYVALIPLASGLLSRKHQRGKEPQSRRINDARVMCEHLLTPSSFDVIEALRQRAALRFVLDQSGVDLIIAPRSMTRLDAYGIVA
jgi:hypothetical protein